MTDRLIPTPAPSSPSGPEGSTSTGDCHVEWKKPAAQLAPLDLAAARERLQSRGGATYWRSLEELAETPEFGELLDREFPRFASEWPDGVSRRNFLQLAAASLGLAGLTACTRQPIEKIVPYVRQAEEFLPGKPVLFATSMALSGVATGLLIESHNGRPTKVEGNPEHPASLGASDAVTQASVLGLYDPDRSQAISQLGNAATWTALNQQITAALNAQSNFGGAGLRLLTGPISSPTEARLIASLLENYPQARWHRWDPLAADTATKGLTEAFGAPVGLRFDLAKADVVLALESDFLTAGPGSVRYARDFAARRRLSHGASAMNRLYVAESTPTATGTVADHRFRIRPSQAAGIVQALAAAVGVAGVASPTLDSATAKWVAAAARDLVAHRGTALVVAGETLPAAAHTVVAAINEAIGASGASGGTLVYSAPIEADPVDSLASLIALLDEMKAGKVDLLLVSGVNPVYDAPADLDVAAIFKGSSALRIHHGLYDDETAAYCQWHVPATHYLESWGDARAYDGTVSLVQPLIEPLYGGKTASEMIGALLGRPTDDAYALLRETWEAQIGGETFESAFRKLLHDGMLPASALPATQPVLVATAVAGAVQALAGETPGGDLELALRPDPSVLDGRFANNGWLQELPKPITKLTWENAILLSPSTAEQLGVAGNEIAELTAPDGRKLTGPVWLLPGQADGVATVHLGYGRTRAGRVANGIGFSAYAAQTRNSRYGLPAVTLKATGASAQLATTQGHHSIDWMREESEQATERAVVRQATLAEFEKDPHFAHAGAHEGIDVNASFNPGFEYKGYAWGMVIDLNACNGCNACVVACQSENNIPVVGKEQVARGREMHWIRVDRYYQGDVDEPSSIVSQPIVCMQCEQAPCEVVCPVAATTHSTEGLNDMVYNRCVGTRYCSNNCPYKVRRFNFLLYQDWETEQFKLQRNPDVTVRSRGVMEKCTYCVQRINRARIPADRDLRQVQDGEILTACQQACPPQAISFGNLNDPAAKVVADKKNPRNYALLEELGTRPRTTYLAMVKNPNPELSA
jgi:molybdopterin-containing oxidoreductase family iron-sulfur binding subunit